MMPEETIEQLTDLSFVNTRRNYRAQPEAHQPIRIDINGSNFIDVLHATDISLGGIGIIVAHGFEDCKIDAPVSVVVTLPAPNLVSITLTGKIRHLSDRKFGVSFVDMQAGHQKKLSDYLLYSLRNETWMTRFKFRIGVLLS